MIDYDFNHDCCGCSACIDACPKLCIKQTTNKYGFIVPEVDKSVCIDCHICENVCPVLNPEKLEYRDHRLFSAINKNEELRAAGSSGSIFYLLAEKTIAEEGIVFGAAFDENLQLRHSYAEKIEELRPLLKSKYLQSNTRGIYKQVKDLLKTGRKVLFVGTPCQCNALYKFLGNNKPENLLLVDFICHGVPSQELFNKSLAHWEKKHNCKIKQFEFRHKTPQSIHSFYLQAIKRDLESSNIEHYGKYNQFPFYYGFKRYLTLRESCYKCKFAVVDRVSDITMADFWGIESYDSSISHIEFNKGISMLIINSKKGLDTFFKVSENTIIKEFPNSVAKKANSAYTAPAKVGLNHKWFLWSYRHLPYNMVEFNFFTEYGFNVLLSKILKHI